MNWIIESIETFRFQYEKSARECTSVILAGKRDSRRHFTTSFCENSEVAKTSPQSVGDLVFLESRRGLAIIIENNCVKLLAQKE